MSSALQHALQKLLDKYPQHKEEKALYDALQDLLNKAKAEDELFDCKTDTIADVIANNIFHLLEEKDNPMMIRTGFQELDDTYGGFSRGEYAIIAGRPGMGKSLFMTNLALNMLEREYGVAYFTFDTIKAHFLARLLACKSQIAFHKIIQNKLNKAEKAQLEKDAAALVSKNLHVCDASINRIELLEDECRRLVKEHKVNVIFIDCIQLLDNMIHRSAYFSRDRELGIISRKFKRLAIELNIAIICSSQLNRSVEARGGEKRPLLSDLKDSGNIEQDADKVLFIYRPEYYGLMEDMNGESNKHVVEIIVAKNRNGVMGSLNLERTPEFTGFIDGANWLKELNLEISEDRMRDFDLF